MRRRLPGTVSIAVAVMAVAVAVPVAAGPSGAASEPSAVPGATYAGAGTKLVVDAGGTTVHVLALPVHADCEGKAPSNEGDYGPSGLGPFTIATDGSFTNVAKGQQPGATQAVIEGRFTGGTARGTVVEPAFQDKGFDCKKFSGTWKAARVKGTGDSTKAGAVYAKDDFSKRSSGFDTYNEAASYAEYLPDSRFRIGTRQSTGAASLRKQPVIATADLTVTSGYTSGSAGDGAGLACAGADATSFTAGYVSVDGYAYLVRYSQGEVVESSDPKPVPEGLLHTGDQAQNDLRLVCEPSPNAGHMNLHLLLDGTEVTNAESTGTGAGHVGLFVASNSGTSEFTFSDFVVRKPKG